jgi:hypothetical protein
VRLDLRSGKKPLPAPWRVLHFHGVSNWKLPGGDPFAAFDFDPLAP